MVNARCCVLAMGDFKAMVGCDGAAPAKVDYIPRGVWKKMLACAAGESPWPLVLLGTVGAGKTCAAKCLLDRVVGGRAYRAFPNLCEELIAVQKGDRQCGYATDNPSWWWRRWGELKCTVVDELGMRDRVSDFQYETLKRLLDTREGKPSVFISNLQPSALENIYDSRIASRLVAGTIVQFLHNDMRIKRA